MRSKIHSLPSSPGYPLGVGEGVDGGERFAGATPTFVLPRTSPWGYPVPEGGWFSLVGLKLTITNPTAWCR